MMWDLIVHIHCTRTTYVFVDDELHLPRVLVNHKERTDGALYLCLVRQLILRHDLLRYQNSLTVHCTVVWIYRQENTSPLSWRVWLLGHILPGTFPLILFCTLFITLYIWIPSRPPSTRKQGIVLEFWYRWHVTALTAVMLSDKS